MTEEQDRERRRGAFGDDVREGIRAGFGILSALKEAVDETVQDMLDRGELSPERAREAVRTTMDRAQAAFEDARTRLDFVPRREFDALKAEVAELRRRMDTAGFPAGGTGADEASAPESGPAGRTGAGPDIPVSEG